MSGGKDSYALCVLLRDLQKRAPIHFEITAVHVDQGHPGYDGAPLEGWLRDEGIPYRVLHEDTYSIVTDKIPEGKTYCSLCSRLRRGILYRVAGELGATKIALGHHMDDFVETVLLNLFFQGSLKAMPARLVSDNKKHIVVRPLVYVTEAEARTYTRECGLPVIGCCCPACGDLSLKRQRIKRLIAELELEHPDIKNSMIKALGHVVPSHLLDTRLNPVAEMSRGLTPIGVSRV
jgi:tRNA 2-thiocytidine biosynthesis protein TtcA